MTVVVGWVDGGDVRGEFTESVVKLAAMEVSKQRLGDIIRIRSSALLCEGRNRVVERFLETDNEWLFMVDTDMVFAYNVVDRLLNSADRLAAPIVGALCFGISEELGQFPTMYQDINGHPAVMMDLPESGLVEVDGTGQSAILTHRSVFVNNRRDGAHPWFHRVEMQETNTRPGAVLGEDLSWCWWLKSRGVKIHVDVDVEVGHVKPTVVDRRTYLNPMANKLEIVGGKP